MNAYQAVKVGNSETYIAIGKVIKVYGNPTHDTQVEVVLPDGKSTRYVLSTSFGAQFGSMLQGGDHVLVRFAFEDQFARVISMDEAASRFQETLARG